MRRREKCSGVLAAAVEAEATATLLERRIMADVVHSVKIQMVVHEASGLQLVRSYRHEQRQHQSCAERIFFFTMASFCSSSLRRLQQPLVLVIIGASQHTQKRKLGFQSATELELCVCVVSLWSPIFARRHTQWSAGYFGLIIYSPFEHSIW